MDKVQNPSNSVSKYLVQNKTKVTVCTAAQFLNRSASIASEIQVCIQVLAPSLFALLHE
jgi:hypothetical protein